MKVTPVERKDGVILMPKLTDNAMAATIVDDNWLIAESESDLSDPAFNFNTSIAEPADVSTIEDSDSTLS